MSIVLNCSATKSNYWSHCYCKH